MLAHATRFELVMVAADRHQVPGCRICQDFQRVLQPANKIKVAKGKS